MPNCTDVCVQGDFTNANLLSTPCTYNGTLWQNCQEACLDAGYQFSSSSTIIACDLFTAVQDFDNSTSPKSCNMTYVNTVLKMFNNCMRQYCEHPDPLLQGCPIPLINQSFSQSACHESYHTGGGVMTTLLLKKDTKACENLVRTVNGDVGGIGVFIAYLIQIVCVSWIVTLVLLITTYKLLRPSAKQAITKTPGKLKLFFKGHLELLLDTAKEFQDTQCFFMFASQIALLRAVSLQSYYINSSNYYQLANHALLFVLIGEFTIIPAVSIFMVLAITNTATWYTELVTAFTVLCTTFSMAFTIDKLPYSAFSDKNIKLTAINGAGRLNQCGFNSPPVRFCSPDYTRRVAYSLIAVYIPIIQCYLYAVCKYSRFVIYTRPLVPLFSNLADALLRKISHTLNFKNRILWNKDWLIYLLFIQYFGLMGLPLWTFITLHRRDGLDTATWTIGQLIALMTYVPVICKYGLSILFGPPDKPKDTQVCAQDRCKDGTLAQSEDPTGTCEKDGEMTPKGEHKVTDEVIALA